MGYLRYYAIVSQANPSNNAEVTSIPVSKELRDELRVAKAERGTDYDTLLRENLSLSD